MHGISPSRLILEVTESRLMTDPLRSAGILRQLAELGVQLSIDDFGTGYSSLAYLQRLDVHELKIDKSFIAELDDEGSNATIVRSTIELGHNLGLRVVAEGVEDLMTARQLVALGCDRLQGYLLGRPSPAERVPHLIELLEKMREDLMPQRAPSASAASVNHVVPDARLPESAQPGKAAKTRSR